MSVPSTLASSPLFFDMTSEEIALLVKDATVLNYEAGQIIFNTHDQLADFGIILSGLIETFNTIDGNKELLIQSLQQSDYFGEHIFSNEEQHLYSARAISNCSILHLPFEKFLSFFQKGPQAFGLFMMNLLRQEQEKMRITLGLVARIIQEGNVKVRMPLYGIKKLRPEEIKALGPKKN